LQYKTWRSSHTWEIKKTFSHILRSNCCVTMSTIWKIQGTFFYLQHSYGNKIYKTQISHHNATIHSSRVPISSILRGKREQNIVTIQAFWYNTLKKHPYVWSVIYETTLSRKLAPMEIGFNKVTKTVLKSHDLFNHILVFSKKQ
jgi:hypothetical protein